jgi:hypothetical protein
MTNYVDKGEKQGVKRKKHKGEKQGVKHEKHKGEKRGVKHKHKNKNKLQENDKGLYQIQHRLNLKYK